MLPLLDTGPSSIQHRRYRVLSFGTGSAGLRRQHATGQRKLRTSYPRRRDTSSAIQFGTSQSSP